MFLNMWCDTNAETWQWLLLWKTSTLTQGSSLTEIWDGMLFVSIHLPHFYLLKTVLYFFLFFFSFFVSHKVVLLCMYKREVCFRYIIPNLTEVLPLHTLVNCVKETPLFA